VRLPALLLPLLALSAGGGEPVAGTAPAVPAHCVELRRGRQPRELVRIGLRGFLVGPEGGPLVWQFFTDPRWTADAGDLLGRYAPFRMRSAQGDLVFRGDGRVKAGPVERRMILEWARQVAVEAAGGRGGAAYGLAFAWHQGGPAGLCEDVAVYLTGETVAAACGWSAEVRGRLAGDALGRVYRWFDRLHAFQTGGLDPQEALHSGRLQVRVVFAGRGRREAGPDEKAEIQAFAAALFNELASRRGDPAAVPRLLVRPGEAPAGELLRLELPERPPPVPRALSPRPSYPSPHSLNPLSPAPSLPPIPGERGL
jgi:hypothetical protein